MPFALAGPHTNLWWLGAVLLVRGFGIGAVLIPPMSVAYNDIEPADIPHATMNTRIAQQVGASFGVAIVAVVLQSLLAHGAVGAFHTAFWWAFGITVVAFIPALALPAARPPETPAAPRPPNRSRSRGRRTMADVSTEPAPSEDRKQERRRGADLEDAILDAAWEQLTAEGYGRFTIDTVAARARTSKPVLYRRWKTSDELLRAAIRHRGAVTEVPDPDTGTLRGDMLALLRYSNALSQ